MGALYGFVFLILSTLLYKNGEAQSTEDPLVQTNVGTIRGVKATDGDYDMFMGIPFGKVDEGNPFGPSIPYPHFNDTFVANDDSSQCPQLGAASESIDCLHLNVYVPSTANSTNGLPVLVWIYGGGFTSGSGRRYWYGPKYLVRHDVIIVTLNYRLGPYGFMCLNIPEVPGNQGLKDQLLALRWINNNIEAFGGDVNKITVFGESAGSMSIDAHLYSEQEKLYNQVILQSGTMFVPSLPAEKHLNLAIELAGHAGFNVNNTYDALKVLATADPNLVIAATNKMPNDFVPCVEKQFDNVEIFLKEYPVNLNQPKVKDMPILIGYTFDEWFAEYAHKTEDDYKNFTGIYDKLKKAFTFEEEYHLEMEELVRQFYIGDKPFGVDVRHELGNLHSDMWFNYPTERSIDKYIDNGAANIFYYVFSYVGDRNFYRLINNVTEGGALHADDLGYLFDMIFLSFLDVSPADQLIIDRLTTMWTNFAKYGDPTPQITELLPVKWEPIISKDTRFYLDIDSELTLGKRPFHERLSFWELFYKVNKKFVRGYREN